MVRKLLKKECEKCGKNFFTYEEDKNFCNETCRVRKDYNNHFGLSDGKFSTEKCKSCGAEIKSIGRRISYFCNHECRRAFERIETRRPIDNFKEKKKFGRNISYDVLNKMEEKKRIMKDDYWLYSKNRDRI